MDRRRQAVVAGLTVGLMCGCGGSPASAPSLDSGSVARRLRADLEFLSSDLLEGRGTPGRGLDVAAAYLEAQLRSVGVEPTANTGYRQPYTIGSYSPAGSKVTVRINGRLLDPKDYVFLNFGRDPARPLSLPLVDAGNGVVYEERNANDLAGLTLRDAAVVVRKGALWKVDAKSVFGPDRAIGKVMAATVRGAGMLVYLTEELDTGHEPEAGFFAEMRHADVSFLRKSAIKQASALNPILLLKPRAYNRAANGRLDVTINAKVIEGAASNVIGVVQGTDPVLRDEWVVLSAHYDHLGMHAVPAGKDGIWNGADDNASGTVGVLEIARRVARAPGKRSVMFLFTSGEDRAILGSAHYSIQPPVPMKQVAALINLDMIGRGEREVQAIAHTSPALFEQAVEIGKRREIDVVADKQPAWRAIYLTDNYHFARAGVPSVHFFTGLHPEYHQPNDTADKIRYEELEKIVELAFDMTRSLADGTPRPAFVKPVWFLTP